MAAGHSIRKKANRLIATECITDGFNACSIHRLGNVTVSNIGMFKLITAPAHERRR